MSLRHEFVILAGQPGANRQELCRRFGISRKTGYKWLERYREGGVKALADRTRRPQRSPAQCGAAVAAEVLKVRAEHPTWGGRKLRPLQRFERAQPNELWQLDFKGDFATQRGTRCHPLTMVDDHSRFNLLLEALANQTTPGVERALTAAFQRYGLPEAILCDNGAPWGNSGGRGQNRLTVWLLRLGVRVLHGRPHHPQTQGKEERFHRTLKTELLARHTWRDLDHCAQLFPPYRHVYNCERPHDALQGSTPAKHYQASPRRLPDSLPPIEYASDMIRRTVREKGVITFGSQTWLIGRAFAALPVGLRPSAQADGQWEVYFSFHPVGRLDLSTPKELKHLVRPLLPSLSASSRSSS